MKPRRPDPILLTPGPLTTSQLTRQAMLRDWGSWDAAFNELTASVCADLLGIASAQGSHVCVPLQGSGTFAVEAALGTLVPREGKVLVPSNGAYSQRIGRILERLGRPFVMLDHREDEPIDPARVHAALASDATVTHVALVHCETGTGIGNPLDAVSKVTAAHGRGLIVDAMSSFGVADIDATEVKFDALIAASGKCLEGAPGMGFVIAHRDVLAASHGNSASLALDLHDQWDYMQRTGQWRFTPPTHVVAALRSALDQYFAEGGQPARLARYSANCEALVAGLRATGLRPFLDDSVQAPVIVTFHAPRDPRYNFPDFYQRVRGKGFILYPGKLTSVDTFRVGCIGAIGPEVIAHAVKAIASVLADMGVKQLQ